MKAPSIPKPMPKWRWALRRVAGWLLLVFLICVAIQVFLAGLSVFADPSYIEMHISFVHLFEALPLLLILFGFLGRDKALGITGIVLFVLISLQYVFAAVGGIVGALHAVNALVMFGLALTMFHRAMPWKRPLMERVADGLPVT